VLGARYLGAMRAAINCALANRQIITRLTRLVCRELFPAARLELLFDTKYRTRPSRDLATLPDCVI
jgi:tRNA-splicing ligase RtcB